jgi:hypothetical protein
MKKHVENDCASFRLENGILHIVFKENVSLLLRDAIKIVAQRLLLQQGKTYPILCNIRGLRDISRNARGYFAVEGTLLVSALALVSKSPLSSMFTKLYINDVPPIRIKMFTDESSAMEFLHPYAPPSSR